MDMDSNTNTNKNANMNLKERSDRVEQMLNVHNEALQLFIRKNADYEDAFAKFGKVGVLLRMEDKLQRAISMHISNAGVHLVNTESLRDTLIDLHNYAAMAIMLMDEEKER